MSWLRKLLKSPWLPWAILGGLLLLGTAFLIFKPASFQGMSRGNQLILGGAVLAEVLLVFLFLNRVIDLYEQRSQLQLKLLERDRQVSQAYQRLEALFQVGQKFVEATDENDVIEVVLKLSVDLAAAKGASFVPLDDHSQPMAATTHGDLLPSVLDPWLEYLASPTVRDRCQACEHHEYLNSSCPLLKGPIGEVSGVYCLPLRRAEREFGVLNIFLQPAAEMDRDTRAFLSALGDVTALALEGVHLRRREIATLRQMQSIRQKTDQQALLTNLLESVFQSLDSDAAVMILKSPPANPASPKIVLGDVPASLQPFMDGVIQGMIESGKPVMLGDVAGDPSLKNSLRSFIGVPMLLADRSPGGAILIGSRRAHGFTQRQLGLLQTVAGQLTLILQNSRQATELEYQAVMEEHTCGDILIPAYLDIKHHVLFQVKEETVYAQIVRSQAQAITALFVIHDTGLILDDAECADRLGDNLALIASPVPLSFSALLHVIHDLFSRHIACAERNNAAAASGDNGYSGILKSDLDRLSAPAHQEFGAEQLRFAHRNDRSADDDLEISGLGNARKQCRAVFTGCIKPQHPGFAGEIIIRSRFN